MGTLAEVGSAVLLFFLVFGMSATVNISHLKKQLRNRNALLTGVSLQFIILPFLGFVVVKSLRMSAPMGISLLVVTSSPGGSYSNWWCSLFNAELALSVTMTAISTLLSVIMLPVNLVIYTTTSYSSAVVKSLDWSALFLSLVVVIGGISTGLICSAKMRSHKFNLIANKLGNVAGVSLVTFSIFVSSSDHRASIWDQTVQYYFAIAAPCIIGIAIATWMASKFNLDKPERVAVAVESCYQNTGIATSVAITMFSGEDLAVAIGVPLFYGICEAAVLAIYCLFMWKLGWTKAPSDENLCVVISKSYEVEQAERHDPDAIEIVLGLPKEGGLPEDLVFTATDEGYEIDEISLNTMSADASEEEGVFHGEPIAGPGSTRDSYLPVDLEYNQDSPIDEETLPRQIEPILQNDRRIASSKASRFGRAVKSLRTRGPGKYRMASSLDEDGAVAFENEGDPASNFEFPPAPTAISPSQPAFRPMD